MQKLLLMMVAVFALAVPSVAFAQNEGRVNAPNLGRDAEQTNSARNVGGNVQQQNGIAGRDLTQSQTIRQGDTINQGDRFVGGGDNDFDNDHVGGGNVTSFGHGGGGHGHGHVGVGGGGGVGGVTLARTGSDVWILALVGGVALAGGLGLLAAQRHGRISA
jgi:LPXTG-motif cell wall-anchored protein